MSCGRQSCEQNLPEWWNQELYSFLSEDFPIQGWVWEFMRRDLLREVLTDRPVDAMNPQPNLCMYDDDSVDDDSMDPYYCKCYKPWSHEYWTERQPVFLPPAVNIPGRWPQGFHGQQYRIGEEDLPHFVKITIDLNRRDSIIKRDFGTILEELRGDHPEKGRPNPRVSDWNGNRILQVWDLRQFGQSWAKIQNILNLNSLQSARNAYNTAKSYIDDGKWRELARYVEGG